MILPQTEFGSVDFSARPGQGRRDRLFQFVILNGRPVHCLAVQQALREAYLGRYRAR